MGRLTTHVLDTAHGRPAAGMTITIARIGVDGGVETLTSVVTNADGRCDGPLLEGPAFMPGVYELHFDAGAYFRAAGVAMPEPAFLDTVILRFGISDASEHYHVPLLVSPFAYSTYRGS